MADKKVTHCSFFNSIVEMNYIEQCMNRNNCSEMYLKRILMKRPDAIANIMGSSEYPEIMGNVRFYQTGRGVLAMTEVSGLPTSEDVCMNPVFGYHIHSGNFCLGNSEDPFADAMAHYNPDNCNHPYHAGDMPPLFGNDGYAFSVFLSNRFNVCEIIGNTVIIHLHPDDFHSQPAGNSGVKIACGEIFAL